MASSACACIGRQPHWGYATSYATLSPCITQHKHALLLLRLLQLGALSGWSQQKLTEMAAAAEAAAAANIGKPDDGSKPVS